MANMLWDEPSNEGWSSGRLWDCLPSSIQQTCDTCLGLNREMLGHFENAISIRPWVGPTVSEFQGAEHRCQFCQLLHDWLLREKLKLATRSARLLLFPQFGGTERNRYISSIGDDDFKASDDAPGPLRVPTEGRIRLLAIKVVVKKAPDRLFSTAPGVHDLQAWSKFPVCDDDPAIELIINAPYNAPRYIREHLCNREPFVYLDLKIKLVTRWMSWCTSRHFWCKETLGGVQINDKGPGSLLPTRVISIRPGKNPYLFESRGNRGQYAALSYCWPKNEQPLTTTRSSLRAFRSEIPIQTAPMAIRKAVEIAESLQIQYLWVDSFAIIQDDEADWEREATKMSEVYSNAYLTIVILDNERDGGGTSNTLEHRDLLLTARWQYIEQAGVQGPGKQACNLFVRESRSNVAVTKLEFAKSRSRWNARAWVCQEHTLSRRLLYISEDQWFWECQQEQFSEDGFDNELSSKGPVSGETEAFQGNGFKSRFIRGLITETEMLGPYLRTIHQDGNTDVPPWLKRVTKFVNDHQTADSKPGFLKNWKPPHEKC